MTTPGTVSSRRIYTGKVLNLDIDEVRFPDESIGELEIIRHSGASAVVPFLSDPEGEDPQLLLIKQYRYAANGFLYELPAGRLDPGEEPAACARRELREETGCSADRVEFLYTMWWRVETSGVDHVPDRGPALIVANHSGVLPWDGLMINLAVRHEHPARRECRMLALDMFALLPFLAPLLAQCGAVRANQENGERLLRKGELVGVFPEGVKGVGKPFKERYRLARFGRGGFVSASGALPPGASVGSGVGLVEDEDDPCAPPAAPCSARGRAARPSAAPLAPLAAAPELADPADPSATLPAS